MAVPSLLFIQKGVGGAPDEEPGKKVEPAQSDGVVNLSRAEAKQAWLTEGSDLERAARQALRDRLAKVRDLLSHGKENLHAVFRADLT